MSDDEGTGQFRDAGRPDGRAERAFKAGDWWDLHRYAVDTATTVENRGAGGKAAQGDACEILWALARWIESENG